MYGYLFLFQPLEIHSVRVAAPSPFHESCLWGMPAVRSHPCSTWDVVQVLDYLCTLGPIEHLSLRVLSICTLVLFLIFLVHRISDLTCLSIDPEFCAWSPAHLMLQFGPGLKQDCPHHASPPLCFDQAPDATLCPVRHADAYLALTRPLRSAQCFFVTSVPLHGAAARATLHQWFAYLLQEAGEVANPHFSPGSSSSSSRFVWSFWQLHYGISRLGLISHHVRQLHLFVTSLSLNQHL